MINTFRHPISASSSSSASSSAPAPAVAVVRRSKTRTRTLESLLPAELWGKVLETSDVETVGNFARTCHEAADLVENNDGLWRTICHRTMKCKACRLADVFEGGWRRHVRTLHEIRRTYKVPTVQEMQETRICGETVLHLELSAPGVHEQRLFALLDHGFDVNAPDYVGSSPLFYAALRTKYGLVFERMLRDYRGDVHVANVNEGTVLHQAAISGIIPNVALLLSFGAKPNPVDSNGDTPLHWAASRGLEGPFLPFLLSSPARIIRETNGHFLSIVIVIVIDD